MATPSQTPLLNAASPALFAQHAVNQGVLTAKGYWVYSQEEQTAVLALVEADPPAKMPDPDLIRQNRTSPSNRHSA